MLDILAESHRVIAIDLPGHGLTRMGTRQRSRPATMATDLWSLMTALGRAPEAVVGHSAGAALAVQMAADPDRPRDIAHIVGVNAALSGFDGAAGWLFPMAARALTLTPGVTRALARLARSEGRVERLLEATGSRLDPEGIARYRRLLEDPDHIEGALCMMAQWSTRGLDSVIANYTGRLTLVTGDGDRTVPPAVSSRAAALARHGRHVPLGRGGHLVHEEAPETTAEAILGALRGGEYPTGR